VVIEPIGVVADPTPHVMAGIRQFTVRTPAVPLGASPFCPGQVARLSRVRLVPGPGCGRRALHPGKGADGKYDCDPTVPFGAHLALVEWPRRARPAPPSISTPAR